MICLNTENKNNREHTLIVSAKTTITATAIQKVEYLSKEAVILDSDVGRIGIKGHDLFVENLDSGTGSVIIKGSIITIAYYEKDDKSGLFKRILG